MYWLEDIILLFVFLGWVLDGVSTIWPNENVPETNPYVVRNFGRFPGYRFLLVKIVSALLLLSLYPILSILIESTSAIPSTIYVFQSAVLPYIVILISIWYAVANNLILLISDSG